MKHTYCYPSGNLEATLGIVGEQPGYQEIQARPPQPFVGPAGQAANECFTLAKIIRSNLYITNVIKDLDAPLEHYINVDFKHGKFTIHPEGYIYIQELGNELSKIHSLNCVVAFGNVPLIALTNRVGIGKWRGSVLESTLVPGLKVVPSYHPATLIPPKFNFLNKPLICEDLKRAAYESTFKGLRREERKIYTKPRYDQAVYALNHCFEIGLKGRMITIDIEVINGEIDCFSIGWTSHHSMSIPLHGPQGDYFPEEEELQIMLLLARIIQDERISKAGANFIFDLQHIFHKYGIRPRGSLHCTQIAQKILLPDYPAGLDFVTSSNTDIPYYKADGKQWMRLGAGTWEKWWEYNALDSIVPEEALPKQLKALQKQDNLETYERQRKLIEPLLYMAEKGIKVDVQGMLEYKEEQGNIYSNLVEQLRSEVGRDINPNSPDQLKEYFYRDCAIKAYKNRKTHQDTTNVDALKRIFRLGGKGSKAARLMLDIRSQNTRLTRYLNVGKIDKDARYRSSYKPVGAETGRISSGETIFGTGGNQQNWPHDLLRFFLFDEGYIGYTIDLSQIENRIVAYVGGIISQIEAFDRGIDLHRLTASIIFGKSYDSISDKDGSSDLGDGRQSERFWGKKGNHAINYGEGYKTFALKNEMSEIEAKRILDTIHRGYPQIRSGYQELIRSMLKKNRTVTNLFGRSRIFLGPIFPSYNTPISFCEKTYTEAYAQLPQSTTADKINEQGVEFIYYNQQWFKPIELLTQIHDSVVFQIPLSLPWIAHAEMLLRIEQSLETPLYWHEREIKTPVDLVMGFDMWKDGPRCIEIKNNNIPESAELLAEKLQENYMRLTNGNR